MAENNRQENVNLKAIKELLAQGKLKEFGDGVKASLSDLKEVKAKITEKIRVFEEEKRAIEEAEAQKAVKEEVIITPSSVSETEEPATEEKVEPTAEVHEETKPTELADKQSEEPATEKPVSKPRPTFIVRHEDPRPARQTYVAPQKDGARSQFNNRKPVGQTGDRPQKPFGKDQNGFKKPRETYIAPPVILNNNDKRGQKKKNQNNEYQYEDKHVINKRGLIRNEVSIDDFDENKTGYRKFRPVKKAKEVKETPVIKIEKAVINTEIIPLKVLSEKIGITAAEITKRLFKEGIMK